MCYSDWVMTTLNLDRNSYTSMLSAGLNGINAPEKPVERVVSEVITSSRRVELTEGECMCEAGSQIFREPRKAVGLALNVKV
ncbi:hypothetical protein MLD52_00460 [Puniceicoccaceae bacterium K14]|nr:hypothetical protein [Puniceicoccaceae bacterium K14]